MELVPDILARPEIASLFQGFEEYIAANPENVIGQRESFAKLASGCNYEDACFLRDWLFENRGQFSGAGRLRTFEAYAIFRGVADVHRNEALLNTLQSA